MRTKDRGIIFLFAALGLVSVLFCGCGYNFIITKPSGFAEYKKKSGVYRAISPDGVRLRVYGIKNDPYGDADMWGKSVGLYLKGQGYQEISKGDVQASGGLAGRQTVYVYRYNGTNYYYSLALFVTKKAVYIMESAGPDEAYKKRQASLRKSLDDFSIPD